jgi:hypothetical protein
MSETLLFETMSRPDLLLLSLSSEYWGKSSWGMKLTTHLHLVFKIKKETIPDLPHLSSWGLFLIKHLDNFTLLMTCSESMKCGETGF